MYIKQKLGKIFTNNLHGRAEKLIQYKKKKTNFDIAARKSNTMDVTQYA